VCQNRLWNLASATEYGLVSLPSILSALEYFELSLDHQKEHQDCNAQTCLFSDLNTTMVKQYDLCQKGNCGKIVCDPSELDGPQDDTASWVWTVRDPSGGQEVTEQPTVAKVTDTKYLAISHVWSDGTGIGLEEPGHVNKCLFRFFANYAMELDCDGIWWDTICIPTDREKKKKALSRMHENFSRATHTLVHDRDLVNFSWRNDGSPCLALALSTWFTRGWTALELYASESVKILFRGKDGTPIYKDLDKDILTSRRNTLAHPAWVAVSAVIKRVRGHLIDDGSESVVSHILAILGPRHTCWIQDRIFIASLMVDMRRDTTNNSDRTANVGNIQSAFNQAKITQAILNKCGRVPSSTLLHGQTTIRTAGPWSWCPVSLFDL
ncbi:hypothetical protein K469DRAFT_439014, partial [Zopfia rhizophila CBS 207.26]